MSFIRGVILEVARAELGANRWDKYTDGRTADHPGSRVSWCGIFALWCLHQAGIAPEIKWVYGKGFASKLPMTSDPKPGDIAYIDKPVQHHAIVASVDGDTVRTVDGNLQDRVQEVERPRGEFSAFFSVEPLLSELSPDITPGLTPDDMRDGDFDE
jgi:hypothetical protein